MGSWDQAENAYNRNKGAGKYLKFDTDGQREELVFLSNPEPVEKEGQNGDTWTAYVVDVWNVEAAKKQQWDMGNSPFKALLGARRAVGKARFDGSVIAVVRNGAKGDMKTTYTVLPVGPISAELAATIAAETGVEVAGANASAPQPNGFHGPENAAALARIKAAADLAALNAAVEAAWLEAGNDEGQQNAIQDAAKARKAALGGAAPAKRAPTF